MDLAIRVPSVNITENDKDFKIELAAPGLERKDFKVEVENGMLCISSEKEEESKEEKKNYTRKEYSYKGFSRSFTLPDNCMPEKILAKYDNGVLNITLPKKEVTVSKPAKEIKVL
jgi:HSP20 family protein